MSLEKFPDLFLNISDANVRTEEIHCYRFKSFTLNPLERQLFNCETPVALSPKAFDVLTLLILNAGHLVTKEELMETIWTDSFVEEANLARLIHTVRKVLGEDENGNKFIETVPTKGYRFVAEVEKVKRESDGSEDYWPDRLEPASLVEPARKGNKKAASRWVFAVLAIVVVAGLVAAFAVWRKKTQTTFAEEQQKPSIAVLPFRPLNTGERNPTDDLVFANSVITYLNQSKGLKVRPFVTMKRYTDLTQDPIAIGKELEADYVLESNYLEDGAGLHVDANLFDVRTGSFETFKHEIGHADVYTIGQNVAAKVVPQLLARLNLGEMDLKTKSEAAWQSYLRGMILTDKRTVGDAEKALEEFNNAIRLDPNYAQAYMGRAHALQTKFTNGGDRDELCGPARADEEKALELDPTLGDAMVMLATNERLCTWEIPESERDYQRAVALSPNSAHVRRFYAVNLANEKRFVEALDHLEIAQKLDPKSVFGERLKGRVLFFARRWDEAIDQGIKVKEMESSPEPEQTSFIYMSFEMKEDYDKAFEWFLVVKELEHETPEELNAWRTTYTESGWPGVLQRRLERDLEAERMAGDINKSARLLEDITTLSVQLGDYDRAFEYMNKAADRYVLFAAQIPVNPYLDPIRSDPRYKEIMARTWNSHGGNYK